MCWTKIYSDVVRCRNVFDVSFLAGQLRAEPLFPLPKLSWTIDFNVYSAIPPQHQAVLHEGLLTHDYSDYLYFSCF